MKTNQSLTQIISIINALKITQKQIEEGTGVSQSQISRLLSNDKFKHSKSYLKICNYVLSKSSKTTKELVLKNEDLINALATTWDGSEHQAKLIADVIYSLGGLCLTKQKTNMR